MKLKGKLKAIFALQFVILLYTFASICAKAASSFQFLSINFLLFYGLEMFILLVYALLWQQVIKKFKLSTAYANKGIVVFWVLLWSSLFFKEKISINNILGVIIICAGIILVNNEKEVFDD